MQEEIKYNPPIEKNKRKYSKNTISNLVTCAVLLFGALLLCGFLAIVQNRAAERQQYDNSIKVLSEISSTLDNNENTYNSIIDEFNALNQSTIETLSTFIQYKGILKPLSEAYMEGESEYNLAVVDFCNQFDTIHKDINSGEIYMIDEDGLIIISSNINYVDYYLSDVFTIDELKQLTRVNSDKTINGTCTISNSGEKICSPIDKDGYYTYSTIIKEFNSKKYFLVVSQPTDILDKEMSGMKSIESVLKGVTVGRDGFLFAVDTNNGEFLYFENGKDDFTGKQFEELGLGIEATKDNYSGYQTIDGVEYYCVAKEYSTGLSGKYTVIAAAVSKDLLLDKNTDVVTLACIVFLLVAGIVCAYGIILRRDVVDRQIWYENKYIDTLNDEIASGKKILTTEEIEERTSVFLDDAINHEKDDRFKRLNIGTRNRKGVQRYLSTYIMKKQLTLVVAGLFAVFVISFFSQTLLSLEDVTVTSQARIFDVKSILAENQKTSDDIHNYIEDQYISKVLLMRNTLQEAPEIAFTSNEEIDVHPFYKYDEDGNKNLIKDAYGNQIYSIGSNSRLQQACIDNGLKQIYIYDDEGRLISTSSDDWYFELSTNEEDQSFAFRQIIDEKTDIFAQERMKNDNGEINQYIGTYFYYFTYDSNGVTVFTNESDYRLQQEGKWKGNPITRHRGLLQVELKPSQFEALTEITSLGYILSGMHVYGSDSFFVALDSSSDHVVLYSPFENSIGKNALDVGFDSEIYMDNMVYNGFQKINGINYYLSMARINDEYISTAVPVDSLYRARNAISAITVIFSAIFIFIASVLFSISSDEIDRDFKKWIKDNNKISNYLGSFMLLTPTGKKNTSSASQRYSSVPWKDKSPEQKLQAIIVTYLTVALVVFVAIFIKIKSSGNTDSIILYIFSGVWDRGFNVFSVTEAFIIMTSVLVITKLAQIIVRSVCGSLGARIETTGDLIVSVIKYGGIIGSFFYCMYLFGFDSGSLLASAGILSIVIGLGAQSLISDILAGIFIVFEGEFQVGDIVTINDFRGQVLEIGLRTTKIMGVSKNIKIFNNSSISGVVNMTQESSFVSIDVGIRYGENLERVERVLKEGFPKIKKNLPAIIDGPIYKGVSSLGDSSVNIKILAGCAEEDTLQLVRDLNREVYLLFKRNNIGIPFPQVTVSYLEDNDNSDKTEEENPEEKDSEYNNSSLETTSKDNREK